MSTEVPELSFKDIEKGDSFSISILKEALTAHGFFSITDHGLSQDLIDKCYSCSKNFFDLDFLLFCTAIMCSGADFKITIPSSL